MENISWFDLITLGLVLLLGVKGIINGFIKEVFGLVGIVGGIYIASRYAEMAGNFIDTNLYAFDNKASLFLIGFVALLIAFWLLSIFIGFIMEKLLDISGLGIIDKLLGFIVGSGKIFLIFSVLLVTLSNIQFVQKKIETYLVDSFMYPIFMATGEYIVKMDPEQIGTDIEAKIEKVTEQNSSEASK